MYLTDDMDSYPNNVSVYYEMAFGNTTSYENDTDDDTIDDESWHKFNSLHTLLTSLILGIMVLSTIIGNAFVIAAVILERNLHGVANYLIVSLAIADLMVASLVMPISALNEVSRVWFLSTNVCDMWVSFDVLCCTASILHLLAISIDRYWAVTNIDYIRLHRTPRRILSMIVLAWSTALIISIPPLFGWKKSDNDPIETGACVISQDWGYTIYSTIGAFYLPMFAMMVIYIRIFMVARRTIRKKTFKTPQSIAMKNCTVDENSTVYTPVQKTSRQVNKVLVSQASVSSIAYNPEEAELTNGSPHVEVEHTPCENKQNGDYHEHANNDLTPKLTKRDRQREKLEAKRERKAARTLGIITGCFIICWLPFFIVAIVAPFLSDPDFFPKLFQSITLWLGYLNSTLNPVIYTIFSPDFRGAFRKILCGNYRGRNKQRFSP